MKGCYDVHYQKWIKHFEKDQIHIIDGDRFIKDPFTQMKQTETFLGLKPYFRKENFVFDEHKGFFCKRFEDGRKECMKEGKGRKHPVIHKNTLNKFRDFYRPHNSRFMQMTNRTFRWVG